MSVERKILPSGMRDVIVLLKHLVGLSWGKRNRPVREVEERSDVGYHLAG
jgi:hypothetical protein